MLALDAFRKRVNAPGWRHLLRLAPQLMGAPKLLSQHVGGMVLSSSPIPDMVPVRAGAMQGRFIMDWDKDSVADAHFAKIDLLSLPVLDQLEEALNLIEAKEGRRPDLSRIDPEDPKVYDLINAGRCKGVFLLQSPAQLKMGQRLRSRNLLDLAYQAAWMKCYYPLEFFVALINNQPMGFYPLETLKQDARRFSVAFLNPDVNLSQVDCAPEAGDLRLGLRFIKDVGTSSARLIVEERQRGGSYVSAGDLVRRTGLKPQAVLSLVRAGAFDGLNPNRRAALWEAGLAVRPSHAGQVGLALRTEERVDGLADFTDYEKMAGEYRVMGIYPRGHLMEFIRPRLSKKVLPTIAVEACKAGEEVQVAGWPVARQHPKGKNGVVFVTIEDEHGDQQVTLWADVAARCRRQLRSQVVLVKGVVSRYDGTPNVIVSDLKAIDTRVRMPEAHDWH